LSDDDGLEWDWDESTFASQEVLFAENPELQEVKIFIEEEEL
jgi:hypothetical protein